MALCWLSGVGYCMTFIFRYLWIILSNSLLPLCFQCLNKPLNVGNRVVDCGNSILHPVYFYGTQWEPMDDRGVKNKLFALGSFQSQHANQLRQAPGIEFSIVAWCSWMALERVIPSVSVLIPAVIYRSQDIVKRSVNIHGCDCQRASSDNKSNIAACGVSFICLSHCVSGKVYLIWLLMVWSTWSNLTVPLTAGL